MRKRASNFVSGLKVMAQALVFVALACVWFYGHIILAAIGITIAAVVIIFALCFAAMYCVKELIFPSKPPD